MDIPSIDIYKKMTVSERWQYYLRRRFQELENIYYPIIDNLTAKLADMEEVNASLIPDLDIPQFSFIKEWQNGDVTSQHVLTILKTMNFEKVAETQLTRRLTNYVHSKEKTLIGDYVLPCCAMISKRAVPLYVTYLNLLCKYFEKLVEIDNSQEKITWIEQVHQPNLLVERKIEDLTFNQVLRQLDYQVIPYNSTRYYIGDNILCLDEELSRGAHAIHWILAPKVYIDHLKTTFNIKDVMDIKQEAEYIKNIIGAYTYAKI